MVNFGGIVTVTGDLSDNNGPRALYSFSPSVQGSIEVYAFPSHVPLATTLIAVLRPTSISWGTPSDIRVDYHNLNAISPHTQTGNNNEAFVQRTPLQPPELGGGIGFRIRTWSGKDIDLSSIVPDTATYRIATRLYRLTRPIVTSVTPNPIHIIIGQMKLSRRLGVYKMELCFSHSTLHPLSPTPGDSDDLRHLVIGSYIILHSL